MNSGINFTWIMGTLNVIIIFTVDVEISNFVLLL